MDALEQALKIMHEHYVQRGQVCCGDITVLWTGVRGEENLLVYNCRTRRILYEEHPPVGMDADYDVSRIAQEFVAGTFVTDGDRRYTSYPAGTYGSNGRIATKEHQQQSSDISGNDQ